MALSNVNTLSMQPNDMILWCSVRLTAVENKTFTQIEWITHYEWENLKKSGYIDRQNLKKSGPTKNWVKFFSGKWVYNVIELYTNLSIFFFFFLDIWRHVLQKGYCVFDRVT